RRESAPRALRLLEQRARGGRGVHLLLTRSATSDKRKEVTHEHHEKADRTPRRTRAAPLRVGRRPDRSGGTRTPGDLLQRSGPGRVEPATPPAIARPRRTIKQGPAIRPGPRLCVPSMSCDSEVKVLWGPGRRD